MTATLHLPARYPSPAVAELRAYLGEVAGRLGIGRESRAVDQGSPVSAYLGLADALPGYPDRDAALLWDEAHGWSVAVETHSGEDLIVLRYLGGRTVAPSPARVAEFVTAVRNDDHRVGQLEPPAIRSAGSQLELEVLLRARTGGR